jgi:hypothetical protein
LDKKFGFDVSIVFEVDVGKFKKFTEQDSGPVIVRITPIINSNVVIKSESTPKIKMVLNENLIIYSSLPKLFPLFQYLWRLRLQLERLHNQVLLQL